MRKTVNFGRFSMSYLSENLHFNDFLIEILKLEVVRAPAQELKRRKPLEVVFLLKPRLPIPGSCEPLLTVRVVMFEILVLTKIN